MNRRLRRWGLWGGIALAVTGVVIAQWSLRNHSRFVNYERLALLLPLAYAAPLIYVDTFVNWTSASSNDRFKAGGALFLAILLTAGCLFWLIVAPDAQAR